MTGQTPKQARDLNENLDKSLTVKMETQSSNKKAPGAFLTISEVADELDVQQHVLRFWETKFSQIKPLKRGGGRRYYRPEDVALLKKIHHLLYTEGYTIKGVQKLLKTQGKAQMIADAPAATVQRVVVPAAKASAVPAAAERAPVPPALPDLTDKQRSILQAMLGDLRDLRDMISSVPEDEASENTPETGTGTAG